MNRMLEPAAPTLRPPGRCLRSVLAATVAAVSPLGAVNYDGGSGGGSAASFFAGYLDGTDPAATCSGGAGDGEAAAGASLQLGGPAVTDTDGDTMPDLYETLNGLDPAVDDGAGDLDGDGDSNLTEFRFGTDPQDPLSFTRLTITSGVGTSVVTWNSQPARSYLVWVSNDLENWRLDQVVAASGIGLTSATVSHAGTPGLFLRIEVDR
jgi:hypothetical protein